MSSEVILKAAELRANGRYQEAIDHIEKNIESVDPDIRLNAHLEAFRAAVASGQNEKAREHAAKIAVEDPDVPSIQGWF
jgi:tetratricopeptide (TPR) repeat protein